MLHLSLYCTHVRWCTSNIKPTLPCWHATQDVWQPFADASCLCATFVTISCLLWLVAYFLVSHRVYTRHSWGLAMAVDPPFRHKWLGLADSASTHTLDCSVILHIVYPFLSLELQRGCVLGSLLPLPTLYFWGSKVATYNNCMHVEESPGTRLKLIQFSVCWHTFIVTIYFWIMKGVLEAQI